MRHSRRCCHGRESPQGRPQAQELALLMLTVGSGVAGEERFARKARRRGRGRSGRHRRLHSGGGNGGNGVGMRCAGQRRAAAATQPRRSKAAGHVAGASGRAAAPAAGRPEGCRCRPHNPKQLAHIPCVHAPPRAPPTTERWRRRTMPLRMMNVTLSVPSSATSAVADAEGEAEGRRGRGGGAAASAPARGGCMTAGRAALEASSSRAASGPRSKRQRTDDGPPSGGALSRRRGQGPRTRQGRRPRRRSGRRSRRRRA